MLSPSDGKLSFASSAELVRPNIGLTYVLDEERRPYEYMIRSMDLFRPKLEYQAYSTINLPCTRGNYSKSPLYLLNIFIKLNILTNTLLILSHLFFFFS